MIFIVAKFEMSTIARVSSLRSGNLEADAVAGASRKIIAGTLSLLVRVEATIAVMVARAAAPGSYARPHLSLQCGSNPLISNPAPKIVLASCSAQLTAAFAQL